MRYHYLAKSYRGEIRSGIMEAKDKRTLAHLLRREGFILIKAEPETERLKKKISLYLPFFRRKVPLKEKIIFTRNLRVMIEAGVSLPKALGTLSSHLKNKKFKKVLVEVRDEIVKGKSFSESLKKYPDVFPELFVNMIKVGEESGTLEKTLEVLTLQMERQYELNSKIKGAMIYPLIIIFAMVGIGVLMLMVVVPKLAQTFEELSLQLPFTTRVVIGMGLFLAKFWYLFPLIILAGGFLLKIFFSTPSGKRIIDTLVLKIPIVNFIVRTTNSAYTVRTLGSLISSGVPIVRSLKITSGTLGNIYFKEAINEAAEEVKKGIKLAEALRPYIHLYSPVVIQMIEVGEETGETGKILLKLAEFFEEEVTNVTKNLASVIEPLVILLIGGVVGFFAVSMVQPMYSMLKAL
ncbi:MAG TPA: type II secretion system F family protein [bacterium]|nr:type II secretion system F family protein [bacterium]HEX68139.1 type II secretion system F family protein [bacterium]